MYVTTFIIYIYNWKGYTILKINKILTRLYRHIIRNIIRNIITNDKEVDDIAGNKLNNRKYNLRGVSTNHNQMNKSAMKGKSSKDKGVAITNSG